LRLFSLLDLLGPTTLTHELGFPYESVASGHVETLKDILVLTLICGFQLIGLGIGRSVQMVLQGVQELSAQVA